MHTPHPPRPSSPPSPGGVPEESDESLAARLRSGPEGDVSRATGLLLARHWQPAHDYAVICLASSGRAASVVTAAAWRQVLGSPRYLEPGAALRPRLLVAVRDTVRDWAADERVSAALPDLGKPAGGRGMRTARTMTAENRLLAERSFRALPGLLQTLLWHKEVEADPVSVPAALLGVDAGTAAATLEQARDQFRDGCVRAHRELAPHPDCRHYNRLLDVPMRRGGTLLPDVREHLAECAFCRHAAEQLRFFDGDLGVLLAEAVLGWGARRYLDSRPGRVTPAGRSRSGGRRDRRRRRSVRYRLLSSITAVRGVRGLPADQRQTKALLTGAGLVTALLLGSALVAGLLPQDDGAGSTASTGTAGSRTDDPGSDSAAPPDTVGSPVPARTRLRNVAAGLCLDIEDRRARAGARALLTACSSAPTQEWSYEEDGLLRSIANPGLCLDSHADEGVLTLGPCVAAGHGRGDDVRYDLTVRGELVARRGDGLAVTATATALGADVVVKDRDGGHRQRWLTDAPATASPRSLAAAGADVPVS
ncbi:RICIN domain-containing protein [Streptomyces minutiscleroticus]|uniref:Hydrolase n=1 Tax=Streptomyces minutiscleroticus TaxID=68238 RepID=A0A918NQL4_9ACTN|nr:RICIN domain-containing protein [Streptomyces minutiscleroticus]GGX88047.1 hydrolase [Streptomyces minutiscleroticus]